MNKQKITVERETIYKNGILSEDNIWISKNDRVMGSLDIEIVPEFLKQIGEKLKISLIGEKEHE